MEDASNYRRIQFEASWEADLEQLRAGQQPPADVDEVVDGIDWTLGRLADQYPEVAGTPFRVLQIPSARGLPELNAWFTVEDDHVCCHRLLEAETFDEEDEVEDEPW